MGMISFIKEAGEAVFGLEMMTAAEPKPRTYTEPLL